MNAYQHSTRRLPGVALLRLLTPVFAAAVLLVGCEEKNAFVPPPPPKVTVAKPARQTVTDYLELTGNSQAINTVKLVARVEGYLEGLHFQDGADVRKGDLLFTIQPRAMPGATGAGEGKRTGPASGAVQCRDRIQPILALVRAEGGGCHRRR